MSRRDDSSPAALLLFRAPWWVSAGLGVAVFILMRWIYPAMIKGNRLGEVLAQVSVKVAPLVAGFFFFLAVLSAFIAWRRRALVDGQNSLESLRALSWKEFEWMVGEAFRRQGYAVEESFGGGPDGGVDVVLRKYGRTTLVQCKHWKVFSVGVPVVREIFGVMTAEKADAAIVITSGKFTRDAEVFAEGKPIELIDGSRLLELVKGVQQRGANQATVSKSLPPERVAPVCPKCGAEMVLRTAKRGAHAGESFWGCPNYPKCTGTRPMS
jgi:restriction system protein